MQVIITYDISQRQTEVKAELEANGFHDRWRITSGVIYYLPNTTLWHNDLNNCDEAITIFNTIITNLNVNQSPQNIIRIRRLLAFPKVAGWSGIPGEPHA